MYLCIYVFMYLCIYVFMYLCIYVFMYMYIHRPILLWNDHNPFIASPKFRPKDMGKTRVLPGPGDYSQADFWDPKNGPGRGFSDYKHGNS